MEDGPLVESGLFEHLVLNLSVDVTTSCFNVELDLRRTFHTHDHVACTELIAFKGCRILLEFHLPFCHHLLALLILFEGLEQILALVCLSLGISVRDLSEILHQTEVSAHSVVEASHLAQLRDEAHFSSSLSVFVDEKWL